MWTVVLSLFTKHWKVMAAIALIVATALFMRGVYNAGKDAGVAETQAEYLERDAAAMRAVTARLEAIADEDEENLARWADEAQAIADAVNDKIDNKETIIKEVPVETLVTVNPDCSLDYGAVELLDQIASPGSATDN